MSFLWLSCPQEIDEKMIFFVNLPLPTKQGLKNTAHACYNYKEYVKIVRISQNLGMIEDIFEIYYVE